MKDVAEWVRRRSATIGLVIFFLLWYALQLTVLNIYGKEVAEWWFYFDHINNGDPLLSAGTFLAPISHDMFDLSHITSNILLLLFAGVFVEPYIGKRDIGILVIVLGYVGTYLANVTISIHQFWNLAGASGGILSLWAFTGLKKRELIFDEASVDSVVSTDFVEMFAATVVFIGSFVILFYETIISV